MVKRNYIIPTFVLLALILLMQLVSEYTVSHNQATLNSFFLFGNFFNNEIAVTIAISVIVFAFLFLSVRKVKAGLWIELLIAGAISNLIDRLRYGGVIDYFALPNLFVFNIADIVIISGLIGLLAKLWIRKK